MATLRQKKAIQELVADGSVQANALIRAGYSPRTARAPSKVTQSKGFKELANEFLPDSLLMQVHLEGLGATKRAFEGDVEPDYPTRHKYLSTAYDIKGIGGEKEIGDKTVVAVQVIVNGANHPQGRTDGEAKPSA